MAELINLKLLTDFFNKIDPKATSIPTFIRTRLRARCAGRCGSLNGSCHADSSDNRDQAETSPRRRYL